MGNRRTTGRRRNGRRRTGGGHPFLFLLLFLCIVGVAAYYADREPDRDIASLPPTTVYHRGGEEEESKSEKSSDPDREEKQLLNQIISGLTSQGKEETKSSSSELKQPKSLPAEKPTSMTSSNVVTTGKLAVVIDDAGRDLTSQKIYESLSVPMTLAVMPNQAYTTEAANSWAAHGGEVIIHQPMEPVGGEGMEKKTILTSMSDEAISAMAEDSVEQVPHARGMNNHQGSAATVDSRTMRAVMSVLSRHGLFFLDSRTNSTTEADDAAAAYGIPYARNGLFVDNSSDEVSIRRMIQEGAERARRYGSYIVIGHCRPHTAAVFRDMVPRLEKEGIEFIFVSTLVK